MLAIRMQRTGRSGHASFRVVVQDAHLSPKSGKFVAALGSYDPHTKTATLVKEKAEFYLKHGAQPSERVVRLFKQEGISLPAWVPEPLSQERKTRNPEKLRRNRPADAPAPAEPAPEAEAAEQSEVEEETAEQNIDATEAPATGSEQPAEEKPAASGEAEAPAANEDTPTA